MKAITIPRHGNADVLTFVTDFLEPEPDKGEVLVKMEATSLNRVDILVRKGYPGIPIPLPHVPGGDIAGIVQETGNEVTGITTGDRVIVYPFVSCNICLFAIQENQSTVPTGSL